MAKTSSAAPTLRIVRKWFFLITIALVLTQLFSFYTVSIISDCQIIQLKNNAIVTVDRITAISGEMIYYEMDGNSGIVMKSDVNTIKPDRMEKDMSILFILEQYKQKILAEAGIPETAIRFIHPKLLTFLILLAIVSIAAKGGHWLFGKIRNTYRYRSSRAAKRNDFFSRSRERRNHRSSTSAPPQPHDPAEPVLSMEDGVPSDTRDIILFFLELHRIERGVPENASRRFSRVTDSSIRRMETFELGVKGNPDWFFRRMSISPLGEGTGSKSKCFYVIYDQHMVVKIPPVPITDIAKYSYSIRREVEIAAQLGPTDCIVPSVSIILKRIKRIPYEQDLTVEQIEKHYLRALKDTPALRTHLQIRGKFALFMALSNDFFVGSVIDDLHPLDTAIGDSIRNDLDLVWEQIAFTSRYGLAFLPVFEQLQHLHHLCREQLPDILKKTETGPMETVYAYQIKNWFLMSISGIERPEDRDGIDPESLKIIKTAFSDILKKNQEAVKTILRFLRSQRELQNFSEKHHPIANVASKMLALLCMLKEKKVALRDLKPDNLFISSTSTNYPVFLSDSEKFDIGVIDVETAVTLKPEPNGTIAQPLLGGTPLYATPLHILRNDTLAKFFGDPGKMLHYEDWFAMIGIIFKVISGKNLFLQTARSFPEIFKILKSSGSTTKPDEATVKAMSLKFWSVAKTDLQRQMTAYAHLLESLVLQVPAQLVNALSAVLTQKKSAVQQTISHQIATMPLLKGDKNKAFLLDATPAMLVKQIDRWRYPLDLPESQRPVAQQMLTFLKQLRKLKQQAAETDETLSTLTRAPHRLRADLLLKSMFQIVYQNMVPSHWNHASKTHEK